MQVHKFGGPLPKKLGAKTCKIWRDFRQLQTSIANISVTGQDIENRKDKWPSAIPPRVANRPEFFGTVPNSDAVFRVPNGSVRDRLRSRIFTEQKSNANKDPYVRFFAFDLCLWVHLIMNIYFSQLVSSNGSCAGASRYKMSHKIPDFPSTTGVLRRLICPKFVFGRGSARTPLEELTTLSQTPASRLGREILGREYPRGYPLPKLHHCTSTASRSRCLVQNFILWKLVTLIPPVFREKSSVNFGPLITEKCVWVWTHPNCIFRETIFRPLRGAGPSNFSTYYRFTKAC